MKTIIHVNQHHIKHNMKHPNDPKPVLTVKVGGDNLYTNRVQILGDSEVVYQPNKPLSCGAHVWIETQDEICFPDGRMTFAETKQIGDDNGC